ncbi:MAG: sugar transferase [Bacteroidales bacterium]|nr:sugar transferase [Bacteroidales bacterium]
MQKGFLAGFFVDMLAVGASFVLCVGIKPGTNSTYYSNYFDSFMLFLVIWIFSSLAFEKYNFRKVDNRQGLITKILICNLFIFFLVTSIMYLFQSFNYSRFIVIGTVGVATIVELTIGTVYFLLLNTRVRDENGRELKLRNSGKQVFQHTSVISAPKKAIPKYDFQLRRAYLKNEIGEEAFNFVVNYSAIDSSNTLITATTTSFNIDAQIQHEFECILNVKRVNDFRFVNKFFESVNAKLPVGGLYIDFFESKNLRKKRLLEKYPAGLNYIYYSLDFIVKRVFPKFALTKKLYFILTRGENRVLSKAEAYGRLYSCGFEILDEKVINRFLYFVAIKVKEPLFPTNPSYGPLIALERIGKGGKTIQVYKMRTMHPFAEYLQDYVYQNKGLQEGGKFKDDFRVTSLGRIMRTFWLDELPMIINLLKGDLKLFGVRPLSRQYFKLYTRELQRLRVLTKPGLIPPFYVDYPKTLDEIIDSELKYLRSYVKNPFKTDWVYFWKAFYNIVFRRYRSK